MKFQWCCWTMHCLYLSPSSWSSSLVNGNMYTIRKNFVPFELFDLLIHLKHNLLAIIYWPCTSCHFRVDCIPLTWFLLMYSVLFTRPLFSGKFWSMWFNFFLHFYIEQLFHILIDQFLFTMFTHSVLTPEWPVFIVVPNVNFCLALIVVVVFVLFCFPFAGM